MTNKKKIGSFYTPEIIANFMVDYICGKVSNIKGKISILEPSAGDGAFVRSIYRNADFVQKVKSITAVEREESELMKIAASKKLRKINDDFLDFQANNTQKFSLVLGNPPYIKKNHLSDSQVELCRKIHSASGQLAENSIKNIWTAFLVRSISFLTDDGMLAFVLPAELLQVKYAVELRKLLANEFERIEVFTFKDLLFDDCKGQDTLVLVCERKADYKGVFFTAIDELDDLKKNNFELKENLHILDAKWNHQLKADEYELLYKLRDRLLKVGDYCTSKPGIVTAANDFFIVDRKTIKKYDLEAFARPIIQKGLYVNGSIELNKTDFDYLTEASKPSFLISINESNRARLTGASKEYLDLGYGRKLHERYKMTTRSNWFEVPNVAKEAQAFFFKRCNEYPKFIKNNAGVLVTDSAYKVEMKEGFEVNDLIYSFYNSLTLIFTELQGRFYGGGVLELTPSEFKGLPVPYIKVNDFQAYAKSFKNKKSIMEICVNNDKKILRTAIPDITDAELASLRIIREKLFRKRVKSKSQEIISPIF